MKAADGIEISIMVRILCSITNYELPRLRLECYTYQLDLTTPGKSPW